MVRLTLVRIAATPLFKIAKVPDRPESQPTVEERLGPSRVGVVPEQTLSSRHAPL
jgi:hypothetical protein